MAVLWSDVIDPAELTGYVRAGLADYEAKKGTLARWLPNREVADTTVRFRKGQNGFVAEASYRAYDAEPEMGEAPTGQRVTLELPAVSQEIPISEYQQLRARNSNDETIKDAILRTSDQIVRSIADRVERTRGGVLTTGKATISQANFVSDDDFGRAAGLTVTAGTLWSVVGADGLGYLQTLADLYADTNGEAPGAIVTSTRVMRALASLTNMATLLANGSSRPATITDVRAAIAGVGLPEVYIYDRRTKSGRIIPDTKLLMLPAPVDPADGEGSELGATFWGQTLTADSPEFQDAGLDELPGIVAGVWRNTKPPLIATVVGDSINLPVLANANLSLAATVLA